MKTSIHNPVRGQTSLEYLLLLAVVAVVVIASFGKGSLVDRLHDAAGSYYSTVTNVIQGNGKVQPINGGWCPVTCPPSGSYGPNVIYRACECPAPAFGGAYCQGSPEITCTNVNTCNCPTGQACGAVDKTTSNPSGCGCTDGLSCNGQNGSPTGSSPDQYCQSCICPSGTNYNSGSNACVSLCPACTTPSGGSCVAVTCGSNQTCDPTKPASQECACNQYTYWNATDQQCEGCTVDSSGSCTVPNSAGTGCTEINCAQAYGDSYCNTSTNSCDCDENPSNNFYTHWNGTACVPGTACSVAPVCGPSDNCGTDSCGNGCGPTDGACAVGQQCNADDGKSGDPGVCGSVCSACQIWNGSFCESITPCIGATAGNPSGTAGDCGTDSCGNSCGTCSTGQTCSSTSSPGTCNAACVPTTPCPGATASNPSGNANACGTDSCGNVCGGGTCTVTGQICSTCTSVQSCTSATAPGTCASVPTPCPPCNVSAQCGSNLGTDQCGNVCIGTQNTCPPPGGDAREVSCDLASFTCTCGDCQAPYDTCGSAVGGYDSCEHSCVISESVACPSGEQCSSPTDGSCECKPSGVCQAAYNMCGTNVQGYDTNCETPCTVPSVSCSNGEECNIPTGQTQGTCGCQLSGVCQAAYNTCGTNVQGYDTNCETPCTVPSVSCSNPSTGCDIPPGQTQGTCVCQASPACVGATSSNLSGDPNGCGYDSCENPCGNDGGQCTGGAQCSGSGGAPGTCATCSPACQNGEICLSGGTCACARGTLGDNNNCGSCGTQCLGQTTCQAGVCACSSTSQCVDNETCQNGTCVCSGGGTLNDNNDCGSCGIKCTGSQTCHNGACACPDGNQLGSSSDCGSCGTQCQGNSACENGTCTCASGVLGDNNNCGNCGTQCKGSTTCQNGLCACTSNSQCVDNQTCQNGTCVCASGTLGDNDNCGTCGTQCHAGATCQNGTCTCASGTLGDDNNCGSCGTKCTNNEICQNGSCACGTGTLNDNNDCGSCGTKCQNGESCQNGACACASGSFNDNDNCGTCGNKCATGESCQNGSCACPSGSCVVNGQCQAESCTGVTCGQPDNCGNTCTGSCTSTITVTITDYGNCQSCGGICSYFSLAGDCGKQADCSGQTGCPLHFSSCTPDASGIGFDCGSCLQEQSSGSTCPDGIASVVSQKVLSESGDSACGSNPSPQTAVIQYTVTCNP